MMNQCVIVGRLKELPVKMELHSEEMFLCHILDTKQRTFPVLVTSNIADNMSTYLKVGDIVCVKGELDCLTDVFGNNSLYISGTKVTFLSSSGGRHHGQD